MRFCQRIGVLFFVAGCLVSISEDGHAAEPAPGADFHGLMQWLKANNPQVHAMRAQIDAAKARAVVAGALPDPMFRLEVMDIEKNNPQFLPGQAGQTQYRLSQMFPLWGKLGLQEQVAEAETEVASQQFQQTLAELRAMLRVSYAGYYSAIESIRINESILALLDNMERVAQTRYANGTAAQQDIIKVKMERTLLQSEIILLAGEKSRMRIAINTLLARQVNAELAPPAALPAVDSATMLADADIDGRIAISPLLKAAEAQVRAAQSNRKIATLQRYPDVTLGVTSVQLGNSFSSWQMMVEMNLPFQFYKRRAWIAEASAMQANALSNRSSEYLNLATMIDQALTDFRTAYEQEAIFVKQLLPQANLTFRSALAGYENGKVDFDALIEAERRVRNARLSVLASSVDQQRAVAQIEQFTGAEL